MKHILAWWRVDCWGLSVVSTEPRYGSCTMILRRWDVGGISHIVLHSTTLRCTLKRINEMEPRDNLRAIIVSNVPQISCSSLAGCVILSEIS